LPFTTSGQELERSILSTRNPHGAHNGRIPSKNVEELHSVTVELTGRDTVLQISRTMRAREVLEEVIVKAQMDEDTSRWALFEVVCDGELGNHVTCCLQCFVLKFVKYF